MTEIHKKSKIEMNCAVSQLLYSNVRNEDEDVLAQRLKSSAISETMNLHLVEHWKLRNDTCVMTC